jgi:hypothetical protein
LFTRGLVLRLPATSLSPPSGRRHGKHNIAETFMRYDVRKRQDVTRFTAEWTAVPVSWVREETRLGEDL